MARKALIHKHTNQTTTNGGVLSPKLPTVGTLQKGEIAVNYKNGYETLSIENDAGEVIPFASLEQTMAYIDTSVVNADWNAISGKAQILNKPDIPDEKLSSSYQTSTLENDNLLLVGGDTYETAFSKIEKAILDNEETIAASLNDLNTRKIEIDDIPTKTSQLTNDSNFTTLSEVTQTIVNSAPGTLDTLKELATALGDDPNFATTVATQIGNKADKSNMTAGTYKSVTVNNQGIVTAGTNPTTLAGYGITDAINTSSTAQTKAGSIKASKFITNGGTSSQFIKGDGSLDSNYYFRPGDRILTNDGFASNKELYITKLDNIFYSAHIRYVVTHKLYDNNGNFIEDLNTNLFDCNYEKTSKKVKDGYYAELYIGVVEETELANTSKIFTTYCHGELLLTFYNNMICNGMTAKLYTSREFGNTPSGWYNLSPTVDTGLSQNNNNNIYKINVSPTIYVAAFKIRYDGKTTGSYGASLAQVEWYGKRVGVSEQSVVTKYPIAQDLWGEVTAPKFIKRGGTSSQFLKADGSVDGTSYGTYSKPSGGIPKSDLADTVQTSLGKADTALQSHQDISGKQDVLTFDSMPTVSSTNPVTSGGVYDALLNFAWHVPIVTSNYTVSEMEVGTMRPVFVNNSSTVNLTMPGDSNQNYVVLAINVLVSALVGAGKVPRYVAATGGSSVAILWTSSAEPYVLCLVIRLS